MARARAKPKRSRRPPSPTAPGDAPGDAPRVFVGASPPDRLASVEARLARMEERMGRAVSVLLRMRDRMRRDGANRRTLPVDSGEE